MKLFSKKIFKKIFNLDGRENVLLQLDEFKLAPPNTFTAGELQLLLVDVRSKS